MPIAMERALRRIASQKGYKGDRKDAFVYGSMRNTGWTPSTQQDTGPDTVQSAQTAHAIRALRNRSRP